VLSPWWAARHRGSFIVAGALLQLGMAAHFIALLASSAAGGEIVRAHAPDLFPSRLIEWSFAGNSWS